MNELIVPKKYLSRLEKKVIFLAGPIAGAPLWQDDAIEIIDSLANGIYITSPRKNHDLTRYADRIVDWPEADMRTLDWEEYYLDLAVADGAMLMWLPIEAFKPESQPYCANTSREFFKYTTRAEFMPLNLAIGFEPEFEKKYKWFEVGKRSLHRSLPNFELYSTLEETCEAAVSLLEG